MSDYVLQYGDCVEVMRLLDENSVDAIVCDPPYGLEFMGKEFDKLGEGPAQQAWHLAWAREAFRVLKPGGHLLAFGGSRTYHRLACAIEDAGFEVRDSLMWLYGTGFPKSLNVQQAINKAARGCPQGGADPESPNHGKFKSGTSEENKAGRGFGAGAGAFMAEQGSGRGGDEGPWEGWGTALKPAHEPVVVARKPLEGTVAANVQTWGTGALNVEATRIGTTKNVPASESNTYGTFGNMGPGSAAGSGFNPNVGRWPANVMLDEEAGALLDAQSEGASRFFYCAKVSKKERGEGNTHPTVKPIALMEYLIKLVTPPGGVVLDPFMGSGSTGVAARRLGFRFIGVEREAEYVKIAQRRVQEAAA